MNTQNSSGWDGDAPSSLITIGACAAIMSCSLLLAPAIVGQLITDLKFTAPQAGTVISAELAGICLASFPAYFLLKRFDWRYICAVALFLVGIGNVASVFVDSYNNLMAVRFCTALAAGHVMVISMRAASGTKNTERSYAVWLIGQLILGAVGLALLPPFFEKYGVDIFFIGFAIFAWSLIVLARFMPSKLSRSHEKPLTKSFPRSGLIGLVGILFYYISIGGVWTFVEEIGVGYGFARDQLGFLLSIATIVGIIGVISAPIVAKYLPRLTATLIGGTMLVASIISLVFFDTFEIYGVSASIFKFAWTFTLPFVLSALAALDKTGTLILSTNLLIGLGLAVGPMIMSVLITQNLSFTSTFGFMALIGILAVTFLAICAAKSQTKQRSS